MYFGDMSYGLIESLSHINWFGYMIVFPYTRYFFQDGLQKLLVVTLCCLIITNRSLAGMRCISVFKSCCFCYIVYLISITINITTCRTFPSGSSSGSGSGSSSSSSSSYGCSVKLGKKRL